MNWKATAEEAGVDPVAAATAADGVPVVAVIAGAVVALVVEMVSVMAASVGVVAVLRLSDAR